jgi:hypothetical protein
MLPHNPPPRRPKHIPNKQNIHPASLARPHLWVPHVRQLHRLTWEYIPQKEIVILSAAKVLLFFKPHPLGFPIHRIAMSGT